MIQHISIIVPVLNEEKSIVVFLEHLQHYREKGHEIILVDGCSTDSTVNLANKLVNKSLISNPGRARQMNLGATHAKNTILLFLHSDTLLPDSADVIILNSISNQKAWGRFNVKLSSNRIAFRIIEIMMNLRSKFTSIATGDQAIFVTKEAFNTINGYPDVLIMEDIALSKKLRKLNGSVCLTEKVTTSSRRWEKKGIIRTVSLMWILRFMYFVGIHPDKLAKIYNGTK